jgi:hypothetical protein
MVVEWTTGQTQRDLSENFIPMSRFSPINQSINQSINAPISFVSYLGEG